MNATKLLAVGAALTIMVACGDDDSDFLTHSDVKDSSSSASPKSGSGSAQGTIDPSTVVMGEMTDSRDGKTYKTVKIGEQTWMAENLNYANLQPTESLDSSSFCYNNSAENCARYGRLYLWSAAMDSAGTWLFNGKRCGDGKSCAPTYPVQGVCPSGWHLPTRGEFETLIDAVGGSDIAGKMLRATSGWKDLNGEDGNGTDDYMFSALPVGYWSKEFKTYFNEGTSTFFWSSTEISSGIVYMINMFDGRVIISDAYKKDGNSVRCVKDGSEPKQEPDSSVKGPALTDSRDSQIYKTVKIGDQVWMAENLNFETDGSSCYNDSTKYCTVYGRLYTWASAMDSAGLWSTNGVDCGYGPICSPTYPVRGVCPEGWHLPTQAELETLLETVGGKSTAAKMLKSMGGWDEKLFSGTDAYAFSALPAGGWFDDKNYDDEFESAYFWSSTELTNKAAYCMKMHGGSGAVVGLEIKQDKLSIRCVMD
ncbi:MAG: fibrobacter succinogenes major paralogous domain-containing protein [Fibrobacter sp.]|uniref:fibrobacter succinogenes major paralogous domain-containing protein n=1 Tax=Fibrobacter sp. TaxID=35828 RepID=UPI0025B90880|nr:fibrobacter succinogenes major paralogous domain-containing protein [Fibrobacter sp.]MBR4786066.1 fibrobacter succinogenes major paralogous domain-containing protein [Fibrobacter sp.]